MQPIRTLVADDEALARRQLSALVARDPELGLVAEACDGPEVTAAIREHAPELALIDIHMPGCDGVTAVAGLESAPVLIFVTAHPEHAVRAFDVEAVDYLLKPFDDARFTRAVARGKEAVRRRHLVALARTLAGGGRAPSAMPTGRIAVKDGRSTIFVDLDDIDWIEAADYYAEIHAGGRQHLTRESLHDLEARLDPQRFVRIHRSAIVNVSRIQRLERNGDHPLVAVLRDGTALRISRSRWDDLSARLGAR